MSTYSSFGSEVYGGLASFGKVSAWVAAIFATVVGVIMIAFGVYTFMHRVPNEPEEQIRNAKIIGGVFVAMGSLIIVGSWVWVYITSHSQGAAAFGGLAEGVRML